MSVTRFIATGAVSVVAAALIGTGMSMAAGGITVEAEVPGGIPLTEPTGDQCGTEVLPSVRVGDDGRVDAEAVRQCLDLPGAGTGAVVPELGAAPLAEAGESTAPVAGCAVPGTDDQCEQHRATFDDGVHQFVRDLESGGTTVYQLEAVVTDYVGCVPYCALETEGRLSAVNTTTGEIQWTAGYVGEPREELPAVAVPEAVAVSGDGDTVYVTGWRARGVFRAQAYTVAYDAVTGEQVWEHAWAGLGGSTGTDAGMDITTASGMVYVTGVAGEADLSQAGVTIALSAATGDQVWDGTWGAGTGHYNEWNDHIAVAGDTVVVSGWDAHGNGRGAEYVTIGYNAATGDQVWVARHGDTGLHNIPAGMTVEGGTVVVTGYGQDSGCASPQCDNYDYVTVAYDTTTGNQVWDARWDSLLDIGWAQPAGVAIASGTAVVTGWAPSPDLGYDIATIGYDLATGNQEWETTTGAPGLEIEGPHDITATDEQVYISGISGRNNTTRETEADRQINHITIALSAATGDQTWLARAEAPAPDGIPAGPHPLSSTRITVTASGVWSSAEIFTSTRAQTHTETGGNWKDADWGMLQLVSYPHAREQLAPATAESPRLHPHECLNTETGSGLVLAGCLTGKDLAWPYTTTFGTVNNDVTADEETTGTPADCELSGVDDRCEESALLIGGETPRFWTASPDGNTGYISGRSADNQWRLTGVDIASGEVMWQAGFPDTTQNPEAWEPVTDNVNGAAVSPDGSTVYVTGGRIFTGVDDPSQYTILAATFALDTATGNLKWYAEWEGPNDNFDWGLNITVSPDGDTVYTTGIADTPTLSAQLAKAGVIGYDATTGKQIWDRVITTASPEVSDPDTIAYMITVTPDGDTVIAGGMRCVNMPWLIWTCDFLALGFDVATGADTWAARYGSGPAMADLPYQMTVAAGKLIMTGVSQTKEETLATTAAATVAFSTTTGEVAWKSEHAAAGGQNIATTVTASPDGVTVYVAGLAPQADNTVDNIAFDYLAVAYDTNTGEKKWDRTYATAAHDIEYATDLAVSPDGNTVYATGLSMPDQAYRIIGNKAWRASFANADQTTIALSASTGNREWTARFHIPAGLTVGLGIDTTPKGTVTVIGFAALMITTTESNIATTITTYRP